VSDDSMAALIPDATERRKGKCRPLLRAACG